MCVQVSKVLLLELPLILVSMQDGRLDKSRIIEQIDPLWRLVIGGFS